MERQHYEIRIEGHLATDWSGWFEGLAVCQELNGETVLSGPLDQAALHGVLARVRDLGLVLVAVNPQTKPRELSIAWSGKTLTTTLAAKSVVTLTWRRPSRDVVSPDQNPKST